MDFATSLNILRCKDLNREELKVMSVYGKSAKDISRNGEVQTNKK